MTSVCFHQVTGLYLFCGRLVCLNSGGASVVAVQDSQSVAASPQTTVQTRNKIICLVPAKSHHCLFVEAGAMGK